jgi:YHS domain-containing protein
MRLGLSSALVAGLALALGMTSCGKGETSAEEARAEAGTVNGLCPVREEPVVSDFVLEHEGQVIGFCCPPCKGEFLKRPEFFLTKMRADRGRFGYVGK